MAPITLPEGAAALRLFLLEHIDKLEHGARHGLSRFADADRILQVADAALEQVAKLLESRADLAFETMDKLRGYLFTVAFRLAGQLSDKLTRGQDRTRSLATAGVSLEVSTLDIVLASEQRSILAQAMDRLATQDPAAHMAVFDCIIGGCAPSHLAAKLGISLQKVNARIASGCRQLAPILARMGYYRETL